MRTFLFSSPSDQTLLRSSCDLSHFPIHDEGNNLSPPTKRRDRQFLSKMSTRSNLFGEKRGAGTTRRILLVEDQEDNRQIVRDLLTATDYKIIEASNGKEAVTAASEERPDLILMDIQLPIMNGYDAARCIKANPALRRIPIIAVTSYALSGEEAKARAAGCDDVVAKPYSPRQLLATIRRFLP
jgi:two-component system, cell cycle response regulator DivK